MNEIRMNILSKLCAVFIVLCHAAEIVARRIEDIAASERMVLTRENKQAITGIMKAAHSMQYHMEHVSDWSLAAAVTDKGECGTPEAFNVLQQDASDLLQLTLWWANASHVDDSARVKAEAQLKLLTKGKYLIPPEEIAKLKTKI